MAESVRDFGAVGDGKTDDTAAFRAAMETANGIVTVPPGTYLLNDLKMPDGVILEGCGVRSVLTLPADATALLNVGNDCTLRNLKFIGVEGDTLGPISNGLIKVASVKNTMISNIIVEKTSRAGVITDHCENIQVTDSRFTDIGMAVHIVFSNKGIISRNHVENAAVHGIQFWGNWKWDSKGVADFIFSENYVKNGGGGGIWGAGGVRIVMNNNIIDGALDVGLDLEWCEDSVICGNTVRDALNAGISLFYSCKNISITGNSIVVTEGEKEGLRIGIWLTGTNRNEFPNDLGHRVVAITGNTIVALGATEQRGISFGPEVEKLILTGNMMQNCVVDGDLTGKE